MKAQCLSLDIISTLPQSIIETILCLLPVQEAGRTSILSKEWRYKWTKIPKLMFDDETFETLSGKTELSMLEQAFDFPAPGKWMIMRCRFFNAIYQVLLLHQGPIQDFVLLTHANETCVEIDQIISHLAKNNTLKISGLLLNESSNYRLPLSIFSFHQLTHLYLRFCGIYRQPTFNGFGSLTSLYLYDVKMSAKTLLHILSGCPLLKNFTLFMHEDTILDKNSSTIIELLQCLPVIENLITWTWLAQCFSLETVPQELPVALVHLEYLCIKEMCFFDNGGLPFLFLLIRCSQNLEKISLEIFGASATDSDIKEDTEVASATLEDNSDIWLGSLNELEINGLIDFKLHLDFVKLILAKSPVLRKVSIWLYDWVSKDEELNISKVLFQSPRTSPDVEIIVERFD